MSKNFNNNDQFKQKAEDVFKKYASKLKDDLKGHMDTEEYKEKEKDLIEKAKRFKTNLDKQMKTEDFQALWYSGVVEYVHKIYQTAADVPKK